MRVSSYSAAVVSAYSQTSAGVSSAGQQGTASAISSAAVPESSSMSVINNIDSDVYNAVDDFLYLSGQDRSASYDSLTDDGKSKFIQIVSKLVSQGSLDKSRLDSLDKESPSQSSIPKDYRNAMFFSDKRYGTDGKVS